MNSEYDVWNSTLLEELYKKDNYKVIVNGKCNNNRCIIFFTSHDLYYPNNEMAVKEAIVESDKYDWMNLSKHKMIVENYRKMIFVRDIYKQWYVTGINSRVSTLDSLVKFLQAHTEGFETTCVGSSAGGYAAAIVGVKLKAKSCFCFSAQFSIWDQEEEAPFIRKYKNDPMRSRYFNIMDEIKHKCKETNIYYFYPANSEWDSHQSKLIENNKEIVRFSFNTNRHGATMYPANIPYVLSYNFDRLNGISKKCGGGISDKVSFLID